MTDNTINPAAHQVGWPEGDALAEAYKHGLDAVRTVAVDGMTHLVMPAHLNASLLTATPGLLPAEGFSIQVATPDAMDLLITEMGAEDTTIVYADHDQQRITAVLDMRLTGDHVPAAFTAGHQQRLVELRLRRTPLYAALTSGKVMKKRELMDFVLDWGRYLADPPPIDVLPVLEHVGVATNVEVGGVETTHKRQTRQNVTMHLTSPGGKKSEEVVPVIWTWRAPIFVGYELPDEASGKPARTVADPPVDDGSFRTHLRFESDGSFHFRVMEQKRMEEAAFASVVDRLEAKRVVFGGPPSRG